jgi:hypothetical protein
VSRQDRARAVLALLSRVLRPLSVTEVARRLGLTFAEADNATSSHPWFVRGQHRVWVTERGWRERLAGHKDSRGS